MLFLNRFKKFIFQLRLSQLYRKKVGFTLLPSATRSYLLSESGTTNAAHANNAGHSNNTLRCWRRFIFKLFFLPRCKQSIAEARGFTLIEMLTTMFIMTFLITTFLVSYREADKSNKLNLAAQTLASNIRLAQNYTLGAKEFGSSGVPEGGWGVYFRTSVDFNDFYVIYADGIGNKDFFYDANDSELLKPEIKLPEGIIIKDIILAATSRGSVSITFEPPDPIIYICRNSTQCNENPAKIILIDENSGRTKTVEVNQFGLIDVLD